MAGEGGFLAVCEGFVKQTHEFAEDVHGMLGDGGDEIIDPEKLVKVNLEIVAILADWRTMQATNPTIMKFQENQGICDVRD
jgi:hypothetical protein